MHDPVGESYADSGPWLETLTKLGQNSSRLCYWYYNEVTVDDVFGGTGTDYQRHTRE